MCRVKLSPSSGVLVHVACLLARGQAVMLFGQLRSRSNPFSWNRNFFLLTMPRRKPAAPLVGGGTALAVASEGVVAVLPTMTEPLRRADMPVMAPATIDLRRKVGDATIGAVGDVGDVTATDARL